MAMSVQDQRDRLLRFGEFEFDRRACELRRAGQRIPLQIQPSLVLGLLIERAGEVVTRADLRARVWPSTIHVDFDHGLNNAITRLRHALDDSADAPTFIETIPRIGYRFTHPLEPPGTRVTAVAPRDVRRGARTWTGLAVAAMLLSGVFSTAYWFARDRPADGSGAALRAAPTNPEAYEAYLRGLEFYERRNKESFERSIEYLTRATELAPDFAPAYAALAITYVGAGGNTLVRYANAEDVAAPAVAAVQRALELEPNLAKAHVALALVLNHLQPWSAATDVAIEAAFRHALQLDPRDADNNLYYANFLSSRGRSDEAIVQFRRALELNPLSPSINSRLGMELIGRSLHEEGLAYLQKTVELDPWQYNAHLRLAWAYIAIDDLDAAEQAFAVAERISPNSVRSLAGMAYVAARKGDAVRARELLAVVLPAAELLDSPFEVAIVFVGLRDRDNALEWLARAARQPQLLRESAPWGIGSALYDWLRDDPRFADIERKVIAASGAGRSSSRML